jgi:hypothetical protein
MNLQHVRAMARKEWRHLLRDVRSTLPGYCNRLQSGWVVLY